MPSTQLFKFKKFSLTQEHSALKIGTDAVLLGCSVNLCQPITESGKPESNCHIAGNMERTHGTGFENAEQSIRILDIGTGCGIILLMLAQKAIEAGYRQIDLTGIDIDSGSIADARTNAEFFAQTFGFTKHLSSTGNGTNDFSYFKPARFLECVQNSSSIETCPENTVKLNMHLICISLQDFARTASDQYDIIASNPPFFINSLKSAKSEEKIAKHNDSLPQENLAAGVEKLLASGGSFYLILPPAEAQQFIKQLTAAPMKAFPQGTDSAQNSNEIIIKSIVKFKTTAAKEAKRWVLSFEKYDRTQLLDGTLKVDKPTAEQINESSIAVEKKENKRKERNKRDEEIEIREMVMMRSNESGKGPATTSSKKEAFTEEYLSFTKDFLLY